MTASRKELQRRLWRPALALAGTLLGLSGAAPAQAPQFDHQWGGFANGTWVHVDPNHGDANNPEFVVWIADDGSRIRRFETWNSSSFTEPMVLGPDDLETLHDVFITPAGEVGVAVGSGGQAFWAVSVFPGPATWLPMPTHALTEELWESFWYIVGNDAIGWVAGDGGTLMRKADIFAPWQQVNIQTSLTISEIEFFALGFVDPSFTPGAIVGAAASDSKDGIYYTEDGLNWIPAGFKGGLPKGLTFWDIDFVPNSLTGFAVAGDAGIGQGNGLAFYTEDGGKIWERVLTQAEDPCVSSPPHVPANVPPNACTGVPQFPPSISPGTFLFDHFFTLYGVSAFTDGSAIAVGYNGQTWQFEPQTGACAPGYWVDRADSGQFDLGPLWGCHGDDLETAWISGQFGAIRSSNDGGDTWQEEGDEATARLFGIAFGDTQIGWAVGQLSRVLQTSDGGSTWSETYAVPTNTPGGPTKVSLDGGIAAYDGDHAVAIGNSSLGQPSSVPLVLYTTTGSTNSCGWQESSLPGALANASLRDVISSGLDPTTNLPEFWIVGDDGALVKSSDGGATWGQLTGLPIDFDGFGIDFATRSFGIVVGKQAGAGAAYRTTNGTAANPTWTACAPSGLPALRAVGVLIGGQIAVGEDGIVLRLNGAGQFIIEQAAGILTDEMLRDVAMVQTGSAITTFIGGNRGVFFRQDGMNTSWTLINSRTTDDIRQMSFLAEDQGWIVGNNDRWADSTILVYE